MISKIGKVFIIVMLISIVAFAGMARYSSAEYGDIVLDNKIEIEKKVGVNPVVFPHWFHRIRFRCKVCHEAIFIMKAGANDINMKKIMHGEQCGKCHNGIIAFPPLQCDLCHSKVSETKKEIVEEKSNKVSELNPDDPNDPNNPIYLGEIGVMKSTGDIAMSGYASEVARLGAGWHAEAIDAKRIPRDKFGLVDWVSIVNKNIINPLPSLDLEHKEPEPFKLDILFEMKGITENVVFSHDVHIYWLNCASCHNNIFFQLAGWNDINMEDIARGRWCGKCHGKVAFPVEDCARCHKYPKGDDIEKTIIKRKPKPKKR